MVFDKNFIFRREFNFIKTLVIFLFNISIYNKNSNKYKLSPCNIPYFDNKYV